MRDRQEHKLILEVDLTAFGDPINPSLSNQLNTLLQDWEEGRQPFCVEMIASGLNQCIKAAAYKACMQAARDKWGNQMTQVEHGRRSMAGVEAEAEYEKLLKSSGILALSSDIKATITRKP
jgi:hypothetical protein